MHKPYENASQVTLAECLAAMTGASLLTWLVVHPHNLLITFVSPVVVYFLWEGWRARRYRWSLESSIRTAVLSAIVSAPLTGAAGALHGSNEGIASTGFAAALVGTLIAANYGLMPALSALVVYFFGRRLYRYIQSKRFNASEDLAKSIVETRLEHDPMEIRSEADQAQNR
jgi:hypothetical protein